MTFWTCLHNAATQRERSQGGHKTILCKDLRAFFPPVTNRDLSFAPGVRQQIVSTWKVNQVKAWEP